MRTKRRQKKSRKNTRSKMGGDDKDYYGPVSRGLQRINSYNDGWKRYREETYDNELSNIPEENKPILNEDNYLQPGTLEYEQLLQGQKQQRMNQFGYTPQDNMSQNNMQDTDVLQDSVVLQLQSNFNQLRDKYIKDCENKSIIKRKSPYCSSLAQKVTEANMQLGIEKGNYDDECYPNNRDEIDQINQKINSCCPKTWYGTRNRSPNCRALYKKQDQLSNIYTNQQQTGSRRWWPFGGKKTRRGKSNKNKSRKTSRK